MLDTKFANSKHSTFYLTAGQIVDLLLLRFGKLGLLAQVLLKRSQPRVSPYGAMLDRIQRCLSTNIVNALVIKVKTIEPIKAGKNPPEQNLVLVSQQVKLQITISQKLGVGLKRLIVA